ncbi:MAG TPA: serine hydrolase [Planctomycetota bacterium]|jgi:CubicO group peptidase (beta-lactamase class C family)|nr:serine hydrolase [Planctomycetota bacterium]
MALILAFALALQSQDYYPPPDSAGGWRSPKDATELKQVAGMDPMKLDQAWELCQRTTQHSGLVVVRRGYLVCEKYTGRACRDANPDMASCGKAWTSIACGIMLKEKKDLIPDGLETRVFTEKYLPESLPLDDPRRADITLGQLLCMSAGYHGEGRAPGIRMGQVIPLDPAPGQNIQDLDTSSLKCPLWCKPGDGYSYSSPAPHIASMVLRRVTGMTLKDYIDERLAKPQGWGPWNYCLYRGDVTLPHANGAGSTALRSTDVCRFLYCLLRNGRWGERQLVPTEYMEQVGRPSKFNPHCMFSLQFEVNADGHVAGAPKDAYWKSGAGGFCVYVVPSLDLVLYKMGGADNAYREDLTRIPQTLKYDGSRDAWKPIPRTPFHDGSLGGDDGLRRVLEMVCAAVRD